MYSDDFAISSRLPEDYFRGKGLVNVVASQFQAVSYCLTSFLAILTTNPVTGAIAQGLSRVVW